MYALLAQEFPFIAEKEDRLYELIKKGDVDFSKPVWNNVSQAGIKALDLRVIVSFLSGLG